MTARRENARNETACRSFFAAAILAVMLVAPSTPAHAFEQGASSISLSLGAGQQLDRDYTVIAGRYGYYFVREFEGSVAFEAWRGNDPQIYKIIPELRYVYSRAFPIKPYLAIFVSRTLYQGLSDRNTYGGKLGAYFTINPNAHLGIGGVYERIENCNADVYRDCRQVYSEVSLHFTF